MNRLSKYIIYKKNLNLIWLFVKIISCKPRSILGKEEIDNPLLADTQGLFVLPQHTYYSEIYRKILVYIQRGRDINSKVMMER